MLAAVVSIAPVFGAMGWRSGDRLAREFDQDWDPKNGSEERIRRTMRRTTMKNFLDALVAVLAGNAIYYLLMPHLPAVARHRLFQEDWGLLADFAICTVIFAVVKYARRDEV
jgi:hypothetical protein